VDASTHFFGTTIASGLMMSHVSQTVDKVTGKAERIARRANPWVERFARLGFLTKGLLYIFMGGAATLAAFGAARLSSADKGGALQTIAEAPFGRVLLIAVAIGLASYALWRCVQAIFNPDGQFRGAKGAFKRLGRFLGGVIYATLAATAIGIVIGAGDPATDGNESARDWTAWLMSQPLGQWLVAAVGAGIMCFGISQFYRAMTAKLPDRLKVWQMSDTEHRWTLSCGRIGMAARGIVFGIVGFFVLTAALRTDPSEAIGLGGALATLAQAPHGPWLLGIVGAGLVSYGVFGLLEARYCRIAPA
jgi:hypothetical protein